ncbi:MAG: DUF1565 domain-containing protein, partial [Candidatus Margulisiibacteriota bacterium]
MIRISALILTLTLLFSGICFAQEDVVAGPYTYYVNSTRPNNSGDGLGPSTAWKNLSYALANSVTNDFIVVSPGTYNSDMGENFPIGISGQKVLSSSTHLATIEESGSPVYIVTMGDNSSLEGFHLKGDGNSSAIFCTGSNVVIKNNIIDASNYLNGIYLDNVAPYITISIDSNSIFSASSYGLRTFGQKTTLINNEIRNVPIGAYIFPLGGNNNQAVIYKNTFTKISNIGLEVRVNAETFQWASAYNNIISGESGATKGLSSALDGFVRTYNNDIYGFAANWSGA